MLTIGKLGAGQERYYLQKVAEGAEDYYSGEGEAQGYWLGDAAEDLGLAGQVKPDQLTAMLTGRNPIDGEPFGLRAVPGRGPVPGFDLTFSAPKSVSLLWAMGGPVAAHEVNEAHRESVGAALAYVEREACWTRRGAGGKEFVHGQGFLAAAFEHRSSRAGDPQLHTHVLIANATKGPDGRWSRLHHPSIYDHAKTAGYIYEAHLRHELSRRLDVEWQSVRNGIAEVEGFSDSHLREFSTRRQQILEAAGPDASARARQVANLATREAKEKDLTRETLRQRWRAKAQEIGLDRETIERTFDPEAFRRIPDPGAPAAPHTVSIEQVDRAVTAGVSHFDRRDAIQAVANSLPNGAPAHEVEQLADAFLASESVIRIAESPKGERFTTRRIWELERIALESAQQMRATDDRARVPERALEHLLAARSTLKPDQEQMVRRLLCGGEGISIVIGQAGTGKTFATLTAAEGWAQAGVELTAAAPTWRAANVLRNEGLEATSIARLLGKLDNADGEGHLGVPRGSVLLIDEAGMVDSATLARLIDHAQAAQAKLVLIGDPAQLGEIEAGGLFAALAQRTEPIVLDEVIRHRHSAEREGARLIRAGEGADAMQLYRSEERVVVAPDADARREAMIADWHQAFERGEDALMVAKRNVEVQHLNELAREVRREAGRLGAEEIEVGQARFAAGDRVITRVNDHANQIYNRERWTVAEVDAEARSVVLDGIDTQRRVCVDAVYLERVNPRDDAPALHHAYAATTYCAQGTTVDRAFVMVDPSMDKQELYVAASRSREETLIYAIPEIGAMGREEYAPASAHERGALETITGAIGRDRAQSAAHEEALRELRRVPTEELLRARQETWGQAEREQTDQRQYERNLNRIEEAKEMLDTAVVRREAAEAAPRAERERYLPGARAVEALNREALDRSLEEASGAQPPGAEARLQAAAIEEVLAERRVLAITAARLSPPAYIAKELGERPLERTKQRAWDRGVAEIESYRQEHRVSDRDKALGVEPQDAFERAARERQQNRLAEVHLELGHDQHLAHTIELGHSMEVGM